MKKTLHLVSFDVPFPADYGGVIDVFYKIKALHQLGVDIILHCFQYGRPQQEILNKYCSKIYYYNRSKYKNPFIGKIPYIVLTRNNEELLDNLKVDNFPILFDGLHCTYFLNHKALKNRIKLVRNHNIEHDYYKNLEKVETNFFKKYFFRTEADNLKEYEKVLLKAAKVLAISPSDFNYLNSHYKNAVLVSAFHANETVEIEKGKGKFILYHGNLSVGENNHAALYLVKEVFSKIEIPVVIAGNNPSTELKDICAKYANIQLISYWNNEEIEAAIRQAQMNVLVTFQATGIKLKLLNALFKGRFCVVNPQMVEQTGLENTCSIAKDANIMIEIIQAKWDKEFENNDILNRKKILNNEMFSNTINAQKIIDLI